MCWRSGSETAHMPSTISGAPLRKRMCSPLNCAPVTSVIMYLVSLVNSSSPRRRVLSNSACGLPGDRLSAYSHRAISTGPSRLLHSTMVCQARCSSSSAARFTRMRPSVSVPVLSVQMVVTEPSVSTASRRLTNPLRLRILRMPSTRMTVTAISRPSGTAAMARMIEVRSMSKNPRPMSSPTTRMISVATTTM